MGAEVGLEAERKFFYRIPAHSSPHPTAVSRRNGCVGEHFLTDTGYDALDDRISKTQAKQERLLVALDYPEVPLHNNNSELGARVCARRRDVSLHSRSKSGVVAMDLFTTIVQTAKKLGIRGYRYLYDRIRGSQTLPSLADLIQQAAQAKRTCPNPETVSDCTAAI